MDIKAKIEELVEKIKGNPDLLKQFKSDPIKVVEGLIGVDLPDDQIKAVADGVKAKINLDNLGGVAGIADKLDGLFGKK